MVRAINSAITYSDVPDQGAYLSYYRLQAVPFRAGADPRLLWLGKMHRAVLEMLTAAIRHCDGILLLTGDVGAGKTSLANSLAESLGDEGLVVGRVSNSGFEPADFFEAVARAYRVNQTCHTKDAFVAGFQEFLGNAASLHQKVLLIIDEAQSLSHELLREIRDLSALGSAQGHSLAILLVGQKELNPILSEDRNAALRQRITTRCTIEPLTEEEVGDYIRHRLKMAGSEDPIFSSDAIRQIAALSRGAPASINTVCEHALLTGHRRQAATIGREIVESWWKLGSPTQTATPAVQDPGRLVRSARRAGEARARRRRGQTGAPVTLLAAMLLIIGAYFLYAGWFTRMHDSTQKASHDSSGERSRPDKAADRNVPVATEGADRARSSAEAEAPISPPTINATELSADRVGPKAPKAIPSARAKDARPKNPQPRETAVRAEAKDISRVGVEEKSERPPASVAPAPKGQPLERAVEAPDPAGVIDWLLKEHASGKRSALLPD